MSVIDRLKLPPHTVPDWLVIAFECDDTVQDIRTLVLRLLTEEAALAPWIPFRVERRETSGSVGAGLSVRIFNASARQGDSETHEQPQIEADIFSVFNNAVGTIVSSGVAKSGVLFIIDEIDRVRNRGELASFIRSRGSDSHVKFALVGVGTTPQELILHHESIVRQISDGCVEMPPMSPEELGEIFDKAHTALASDGVTFSPEAQAWIISVARGHPYYVHLIGKHSLIQAVVNGRTTITEAAAKEALADIALNGTARVQETIYQKAIGHSYTREYILKSFASAESDEVNTTSIYSQIASSLRIDQSAISVYVGHLASEKFGSVLAKTRERYYRFTDSLFKAYAAARPFHYRSDQLEQED